MALVQYMVHQLALRVDPKAKNGDKFVQSGAVAGEANIGSTAGDRFPAAQLVKIYNQSRIALFQGLEAAYPDRGELTKRIGGTVQHTETLTFTLTGSISVAAKPTGYIRFISAAKADKTPIILLGADEVSVVQQSTNPYRIQAASGPIFVFEVGVQLVHYGTLLTTLSTYILSYIGITDWVVTDVTNGSSVETINDIYLPLLLDLAVMIANGAGNADVVAMAKAIVESKKQ